MANAKITKVISGNKLLLLVIAVIVINAVFATISTHSAYLSEGDSGMAPLTVNHVAYPFFIWSYINYSGYTNNFNLSNPLLAVYYLIIFLLSGLKSGTVLNSTINVVILRVLAGTGMFLLVYALLNSKKAFSKAATAAGLFSSLLFTLHYGMFSSFGAGVFNVALLPFAVLFLLIFTREIYAGKFNYKYFVLAVLTLALEMGFLNYVEIIQGFLIMLSIFVFVVVFANRKTRARTAVWLLTILLLSVAINASWIVMTHTAANLASNELHIFSVSAQSDFVHYYAPIVAGYEIQLMPNSGGFAVGNMLFNILATIIALGSVFFITSKVRHASKPEVGKVFVIAMIVALLVLFAADASMHRPFGSIFSALYIYIPYLIVFKYAANTHYIMLFLVSVLSGFTIGNILADNHTKKQVVVSALVIALMAILLTYYLYVGSFMTLPIHGVPYGTGTQYATLLPFVHSIPQYALNISNYINSQGNYFAAATLPVDDDWHLATWYDAPDAYAGLIDAPVYTGGFAVSEFFFPSSQGEYGYIGRMVQNGNTKNFSVSNGLGIFGIKYVIVQGDTSNHTLSPNNPLLSYSFNDIYSNLNASSGMAFLKKYNTSSIYVDTRAVPLAYATNIRIVNTTSSVGIIDEVLNKSFNISEYSLYSRNFSAPILWYGSTQIFDTDSNAISPVPSFSPPNITFVKNSPTKVAVSVSNATTPFYLIFRETYDPYWNAYYSNGTAVPQVDHIAVNGFANAWYMDRTGNYTVTLYYTPQTTAWIAWAISFIALGVTVAIGVYGWKGRKGR